MLFGLVVTRVESADQGIRLADGGTDWGRVEVFHDGVWGSVCNTNNDYYVARVVCNQLGMSSFYRLQTVDFPKGTSKIWLHVHACNYGTLSINNCTHHGWGQHNCTHDNDIGVLCVYKNCRPGSKIANGNITSSSSGYGSTGRVVCDPGYRPNRNLTDGGVRCLRNGELEAIQCEPFVAHTDNLNPGVRLTGGRPNWGLVEVFHDGKWGTVCNKLMNLNFADVLCRQLGMHNGGFLATDNFGKGNGTIWLDGILCTGTELSIMNCSHKGWGSHTCVHSQDVGVMCNARDCDASPTVFNGKLSYYSTSYGSHARVICDTGYRVYQNLTAGRVRCMPHGEWETVQCEKNVALGQTMNNSG
ncbi:hypothetical protein DPMN_124705 [Dreissena polymorpha]|uniref:Deleted in malignant brain tumors 1 protein-like n=1 Tax=Dreissena polymorpha TaxID=45954 RepID=A0A9D4GWU1_DREPO|nr:hypothetical protein DPMN_124705 [Dreissena polymorpha]